MFQECGSSVQNIESNADLVASEEQDALASSTNQILKELHL